MRRRRILLGLIALFLLVALIAGSYFLKAKYAVAAYRKQLIASGEVLSVKELWPPEVPESQNGASLFLKAMTAFPYHGKDLFETNPPQAMTLLSSGRAVVCWQQPALISKDNSGSTNTWDDLNQELSRYAAGLVFLDQLSAKRTIDFRFDYNQGFEGLLPNLAPIKRTTQVLSYATIAALHDRDLETALARIRVLMAFIRANQDERLAISQLVRFAVANIVCGAVWEYLQVPQLPDADLAELQKAWSDLEFIRSTENALLMERAISETTINDMRKSRAQFRRVANGFGGGGGGGGAAANLADAVKNAAQETWEGTVQTSREVTWRVAWSYPDQLRMLKGQQVLIEALRDFETNRNYALAFTAQQQRLEALGLGDASGDDSGWLGGDVNLSRLFSSGVRSLQKIITKVMQTEVHRSLVVTAIALKRYQLRHGKLPQTLAELTPGLLPAVPNDPADGQPLRYRPQADGSFLLYSVGKDGRDDGGSADPENPSSKSKSWQTAKDTVWPQPATAQEIEAEVKAP